MENSIKLSPAELELIKLRREEAELKARQEAIEKEKRDNKEILRVANEILEFKKQQEAKEEATLKFFESFPKESWKLETEEMTRTFVAKGDYNDDLSEREVLHEEAIEYVNSTITFITQPRYYVKVKEHFVYEDSSWRSRMVSRGFKMFLYGVDWKQEDRPLSNPKTVVKKVEGIIASELAKKVAAKRKANAFDTAFEEVKGLRKGT